MAGSLMPPRRLKFLSAAVFVGLSAPVSPDVSFAGDIYKTTDANGQVIYADRPASESAQRVSVPSRPKSTVAERQRIQDQMEAMARLDTERTERDAAEKQEQSVREEAERMRQDRCKKARDRYVAIADGAVAFHMNEQDEYVEYTSEELDAERAAAKQAVDELCN